METECIHPQSINLILNYNMENNNIAPKTITKKPGLKGNALAQLYNHGRVMPQAVDLEEAVLGALMLEKNALTLVIDILRPVVFYKEAHIIIYEAIRNLFSKSEPIDLLTVVNELKNMGKLDLVGGAYYIAQLTSRIASSANIEFHAKILLQKYIQRELIRTSTETINDAFDDTNDVFDLLDRAEKNLFDINESNFKRESFDMTSLVRTVIDTVSNAREHTDHISGIPTGFSKLDALTGGWQRSDLIVVAARPGMGKTALILSMARNMAVDFKKAIAIFSLEMSSAQLVMRLMSGEARIPAEKLRKGSLDDRDWTQFTARANTLVTAPLYIDDTPSLSVFELRAKCRRLKEQYNIECIMIDYIQLMTAGPDLRGNREQEISTISRSLKSLAKELNVPVIVLSQLNRGVETRGGTKRPMLSDLRESGAIEQDADIVGFIYRPEYYKIEQFEDGSDTQGLGEFMIAKHRNGALENVRLRFEAQFAQFLDTEAIGGGSFIDNTITPNTEFDVIPSRMNRESEETPF